MDLPAEIDALVEVGRRAPGSDAERRAARYLESRLRALGRDAAIEPVEAWPAWPVAYAGLAALSVAGSVLSVSSPIAGAVLAFAAALLTFVDAGLLIPTLRRLAGRRASQNVVSWGDRRRPGQLVIVAHYDAGRGGLLRGRRARRRWAALARLIRRPTGGLEALFVLEVAVLACSLLRLPGLEGTALSVIQFIPTALLIVAIALLLDIALSATTAGENDNASGAALALRLAERLGDGRLEHFDVHVVLTGAHEAAAAGMRSFLGRHRGQLPAERTAILNLDEVGSGSVRYTSREGPLFTIRSHRQLVDLCAEIAEDDRDESAFGARPITGRAASDAYAARSAGLPAITVTCREPLGYASGRVEQRALERAEAFCAELIERLDAEVGPGLAVAAEESVLSEAEER